MVISMLSDEISKVNVDEHKLRVIIKQIIEAEKNNLKTKERTSQEMINVIKKIFENNV